MLLGEAGLVVRRGLHMYEKPRTRGSAEMREDRVSKRTTLRNMGCTSKVRH